MSLFSNFDFSDSIEEDNNYFGNTSNIAEILASGSGLEIKGKIIPEVINVPTAPQ